MNALVVILILASPIIYFLPVIIASVTRKKNTTAIGVLNLFLGWTILGWIISLTWACVKD